MDIVSHRRRRQHEAGRIGDNTRDDIANIWLDSGANVLGCVSRGEYARTLLPPPPLPPSF